MTEPRPKAWAHSYLNQDLLFIETHSGYRGGLPDPQGRSYSLRADASDEEVGSAVLSALSASRFLHPSQDPHFFDMRGRVVPEYNAWVKATMERHSYKTKRAMFKDMKSCSIESDSGAITIKPSHHEGLEAWSGAGIGEDQYVRALASLSPGQIGAAVRQALERCT